MRGANASRLGRSPQAVITTTSLGRFVVNLGHLSRIPRGEGRVFQIGGTPVAVFHTRDGGIYATESTCTHKGGPLTDGVVGAQKVICPLHSYVFDMGTGHPVGHDCRALKTYPTMVSEEGEILIGIEELLAAR
jgi:nitrite reductase (NADH) small subunit